MPLVVGLLYRGDARGIGLHPPKAAMRGESQVEIAFLILLTAAYYSDFDANSALIGEAAGCNPVIVRRIYKKLKDADLLDTKPGRYGLHLTRKPEQITYAEVIEAVRPLDAATTFGVLSPLSGTTPVAEELFAALDADLAASLSALREALGTKTLANLAAEIHVHSSLPQEEQNRLIRSYMVDAEKRHSTC